MNIKQGSEEWKALIKEGAEKTGVVLDHKKANMFGVHAKQLLMWNKKTNLTAIKTPFEVAVKHYIDSIYPCMHIPDKSKIIDIGSGGGFPGIVLKIVNPSLDVTLIDASRKKVSFLNYVIRELKLDNIKAVHVRVEDLAQNSLYKKSFDIAISRAFSRIDIFFDLSLPLVMEKGRIIAMKGKNIDDELLFLDSKPEHFAKSIDIRVLKYKLAFTDSIRSMVEFTLK